MTVQPLFFRQADLENRIGARRVARIYDDNRNGSADADPILSLRRDASSKVASYLAPLGLGTFGSDAFNTATGELIVAPSSPTTAVIDPEVLRLSLDVAVALAAQRHPTILQMDWKALMEQAERDLDRLRLGKTTLLTSIPHAANHGATLLSGDVATEAATTQRFWDDMGDFGGGPRS